MRVVDSPLLAATPSVRGYTESDRERWRAFVAACPDASFFHRIEWRDLLQEVFGHRPHYLVAERAGGIVGVLPLAEVRSLLFGHALVSLPFAAHAGVAAISEDVIAPLHRAAAELARTLGVDHLELRNRVRREAGWPQQDLYVNFRRPISGDHETNLLAIPRKQRAMVRKAMQRGLTATVERSAKHFFDLYADNVQRHGTPALPRSYFERLLSAFGEDCDALVVSAPDGRPVSGVLSFWFRDEVLPYYAGDLPAARALAANDFKYWALMQRAADRGVRLFDYGRSKRGSGSYDFKRNWGFEPEPLAYEYTLCTGSKVPQHNPLNPKYRALIALWQRLPRPVANALGPRIVRGLG